MFGKYDPLCDYLAASRRGEVTLKFTEIEAILNCKLPESARRSPAFWGNDYTHSQARAWMLSDRMTRNVSIMDQRVTFVSDKRAWEKAEQVRTLEGWAMVHRSRRAAAAELRAMAAEPQFQNRGTSYTVEYRMLACMASAVFTDYAQNKVDLHPAPARGRRTLPGPGTIIHRCGARNDALMYLTFFDGHMNVVVRLAERFANITHWPSPRAIYAVQFINAWEAQHPWLTFVRGVTTGPDDPTTLFASLSLAKWRFHVTEHDYVRIHRWLRYEVDAFENALDKLRSRKTAMTGRRAADLAQKRLARHVRPDKGLVTSSARSNSTEFLLAFRTIQESGILLARD